MSHLSHYNSQFCLFDLFEFCIYFQNDVVYHTIYNDFQMLGTNSYRSCVTMSFHMENAFYYYLFFFNLIYLYCIYCYIYQIFVSNKDLFGCFLLLTLPVYLITQLLLQQLLLLNFVNLSHLLKLFFRDSPSDN